MKVEFKFAVDQIFKFPLILSQGTGLFQLRMLVYFICFSQVSTIVKLFYYV